MQINDYLIIVHTYGNVEAILSNLTSFYFNIFIRQVLNRTKKKQKSLTFSFIFVELSTSTRILLQVKDKNPAMLNLYQG